MPNPGRGDVHVNRPLTNILVACMQDPANFVADEVFPQVAVPKISDRYFTYSDADWFRDEAEERAPGTESSGTGWSVDNTPNYACRPYAHHKDVAEQDRENQDSPINLDRDATAWVGQKLLIKKERKFASTYMTTGVWANTDQTGVSSAPSTDQFLQFDQAASDPISVIKDRILTIHSQTGHKPNKLVIGPRVFRVLEDHALLLDRVKAGGNSSNPAKVSAQAMAEIFGLDKVLVPGGVVNTAARGATASIDFIFGKNMLLVYAAPNPGILVPSAGYCFTWTGLSGSQNGVRISKWWQQNIKSDRIEGEVNFDHKVVHTGCGQFFASCVA
jgi:hypothetical protein